MSGNFSSGKAERTKVVWSTRTVKHVQNTDGGTQNILDLPHCIFLDMTLEVRTLFLESAVNTNSHSKQVTLQYYKFNQEQMGYFHSTIMPTWRSFVVIINPSTD